MAAVWQHPLIVHVPLVLIPIAVLFFLADLFRPRDGLRWIAMALLGGGVLGAILAASSGEEAEAKAKDVRPAVASITVNGTVPKRVADGELLQTHATLGEMTRNLYGVLAIAQAGILFLSLPVFAAYRRGLSLSGKAARIAQSGWVSIAVVGLVLVVLTGHYGGSLVYDHGVGMPAQVETTAQR